MVFPGAIYHVTFRGNARQEIFLGELDRQRMRDRLREAVQDHVVRLYAYCFMPNHVHLLLETPRANISAFMSSLLTGYTMYFNLAHQRAGHLF